MNGWSVPSELWVVMAAGIGVIGGWGGAIFSTWAENKRHRQRLVFESALQEWKGQLEAAQFQVTVLRQKSTVMPVLSFVHFHTKLIELVESGNLKPDTIRQLLHERDQLQRVLMEHVPPIELRPRDEGDGE